MTQVSTLEFYKKLVALCQARQFQEAVSGVEKLVGANPNQFEFWQLYGAILNELNRFPEAEKAFLRSVELKPDDPVARFNLGVTNQKQHKHAEAAAAFSKAVILRPDYAVAHNNLGIAYKAASDWVKARAAFKVALSCDETYIDAAVNLVGVLIETDDLDVALAVCERALEIEPDRHDTLALRFRIKACLCDFKGLRQFQNVSETLGIGGRAVPPLSMLSLEDNPKRQAARSKNWAKQQVGTINPKLMRSTGSEPKRLRIGYFSADFHDHATMRLMSGMFRCHDAERFEVHAYSLGSDDQGALIEGVRSHVSAFHSVQSMSDAQIVDLAHADSLDIAIDINGHTRGARLGVFAQRVAPLQIGFLGYPGTSGMPMIDYVIADQTVVPVDQFEHYIEKIIQLPGAYQPNDDQRVVGTKPKARSDANLPEEVFVFCCFNACHKFGEAEFEIWMRLLRKVRGSVLWLIKPHPTAMQNLKHAAEAAGVSAERLIFAEKTSHADHLARHQLADLFLDTFHYNAHTTASDALWAGLPLVTKVGTQFSARVAASLLNAIGLPELIAQSANEYEMLCLELAQNPTRLSSVRGKLSANRSTQPLFDTESYTRNFEVALREADRMSRMGFPPEHVSFDRIIRMRTDAANGSVD